MNIEKDIMSIVDDYETFFIDIYGVLFDGINLYNQTLITLEKLRKNGKKVIILSNTTQVSIEAKIGYAQRGMFHGVHYDEFITSGEFLNYTIKNDPENFARMFGGKADSVKCIFTGNANIFEGTHLKKSSIGEADVVYVGIPRSSYGTVFIDDVWDCNGKKINIEDVVDQCWYEIQDNCGRQGFAEFARQLDNCLKLNKTLLVANPDIFFHCSGVDPKNCGVAVVAQGAIAAYYEKIGGNVVYFGKPYPGVFGYAQQLAGNCGKKIMIGDTLWTDILGANACGLDSALVTETGVTCELMKKMEDSLNIEEKFKILYEKVAPKMTKISPSSKPTHLLRRFCSSKEVLL
ncbi:MAG: HAD hydrolase-like protein [Holosporaceae bacterium]|nr:HAD hydrolase-like protein [Holosporaceae bacterium]